MKIVPKGRVRHLIFGAVIIVGIALAGLLLRSESERESKNYAGNSAEETNRPKSRPSKTENSDTNGHSEIGSGSLVTPDSARLKLLEFEKEPDNLKRSKLIKDLVTDLCKNGYYDEAWEILESQPAGSVRFSAIKGFFENIGNLDRGEVIERIKNLREEGVDGDPYWALGGYLSSLTLSEMKELSGREDFSEIAALLEADSKIRLQNTIQIGFARYFPTEIPGIPFDSSFNPAEVIGLAREFLNLDLLGEAQFTRTVSSIGVWDSFQKWQALTAAVDVPANPADQHRANLLRSMMIEDADRAIKEIVMFPGDQTNSDLRTALGEWSTFDPKSASRWYDENQSLLPLVKREAAVKEFFEYALSAGENDNAALWAGQMQNQEAREAMLARIPKQ